MLPLQGIPAAAAGHSHSQQRHAVGTTETQTHTHQEVTPPNSLLDHVDGMLRLGNVGRDALVQELESDGAAGRAAPGKG